MKKKGQKISTQGAAILCEKNRQQTYTQQKIILDALKCSEDPHWGGTRQWLKELAQTIKSLSAM